VVVTINILVILLLCHELFHQVERSVLLLPEELVKSEVLEKLWLIRKISKLIEEENDDDLYLNNSNINEDLTDRDQNPLKNYFSIRLVVFLECILFSC